MDDDDENVRQFRTTPELASHFIIVSFIASIERLQCSLRMIRKSIIRQEKVFDSQTDKESLVNDVIDSNICKETYEYVASSSYAVECPTPFREPAVASDRCARSPLSLIPELRMRSRRTNRFDKKSDELVGPRV